MADLGEDHHVDTPEYDVPSVDVEPFVTILLAEFSSTGRRGLSSSPPPHPTRGVYRAVAII